MATKKATRAKKAAAAPRTTKKAAPNPTKKPTKKPAARVKRPSADQLALCSARVIGPKAEEILFAYRQAPTGPRDSGWRFLHGDESQAYLDDGANCLECPVSLVLAVDESVEAILEQGVGTAFERETRDDPWSAVADYDPER